MTLDSICDYCATPINGVDVETCQRCGATLCERCIGEDDHECEPDDA